MNQELLDYIVSQRKEGFSDEQIRKVLEENKWDVDEIGRTFNFMDGKYEQLTLPSSGALLSESIKIFKQRVVQFVMFGISSQILITLLILFVVADPFSLRITDPGVLKELFRIYGLGSVIGLTILTVLLVLISQSVAILGVILMMKYRREQVNLSVIVSEVLGLLPAYWWVSILVFISVLGGFFMLMIPGIYFSIALSFCAYIIADKQFGWSAVRRSYELVQGRWWAVWFRLFVVGFVISIISFLTSLVVGMVGTISGIEIIAQIVSMLVSGITVPLSVIYTYLLYEGLVALKKENEVKSNTWFVTFCAIFGGVVMLAGIGGLGYVFTNNDIQEVLEEISDVERGDVVIETAPLMEVDVNE